MHHRRLGEPPHYNETSTDLWSDSLSAYAVQPPFELVCPEPVGDSWGVKSLLVVGPIQVGANLTFVTQFYQNLEVYEGGRVVKPSSPRSHLYGESL